jgi:hypothetical protein
MLRFDVSFQLVLPRLPALLCVGRFVADASWEEEAPAAIPVVSLDMHKVFHDTGIETNMMTSARSKMIMTEGTMMAMTMVPLRTLAGASASMLLAIIMKVGGYNHPE